MSSYFANSYIPDLRNGGVEHPHQHQQHYGAAVQVPQQAQTVPQQPQQATDPCDPTMLRQGGMANHHYGTATGQPGMPYPRFPPYDRMDIRNAAYYQQQQQQDQVGMGDLGSAGYRSNSPGNGLDHLGGHTTPNGHPASTPIVYASCKLQAAAVDHQGSVLDGPDSPPLVDAMHQQMHPSQMAHMQAQQHPHEAQHHQHMMYQQQQNQNQQQVGMLPQQQTQAHQGVVNSPLGQQQPGTPQNNQGSNLPSPLYPWMRSQFGKSKNYI